MIIISDTSPISNFFIIGKLQLLQNIYENVIIPEAVYNELTALQQSGFDISNITLSPWITVQKITSETELPFLLQKIDRGEAEAIILAKELHAELLLMDESRGRKIAKEAGLQTIGLLGVLLEAKSKAIISSVKEIIDELKNKAKFRIHEKLYKEVLLLANEES